MYLWNQIRANTLLLYTEQRLVVVLDDNIKIGTDWF